MLLTAKSRAGSRTLEGAYKRRLSFAQALSLAATGDYRRLLRFRNGGVY